MWWVFHSTKHINFSDCCIPQKSIQIQTAIFVNRIPGWPAARHRVVVTVSVIKHTHSFFDTSHPPQAVWRQWVGAFPGPCQAGTRVTQKPIISRRGRDIPGIPEAFRAVESGRARNRGREWEYGDHRLRIGSGSAAWKEAGSFPGTVAHLADPIPTRSPSTSPANTSPKRCAAHVN